MKIQAELVKCKDLNPGDLFSAMGPDYWKEETPGCIGEKVYIRTNQPALPDQAEGDIYRITIVQ